MPEPTDQVDAFTLSEPETGEECWAGVRVVQGQVLLALSRMSDGDVEVALSHENVRRLAHALMNAIKSKD